MINKLFAPFTASNIVQNTRSTFHCSFLFFYMPASLEDFECYYEESLQIISRAVTQWRTQWAYLCSRLYQTVRLTCRTLAVMSSLKLAVFLVSLVSLCSAQSCSDFSEGLCPLSEDNIVGSIVSPNVEECQSTCRFQQMKKKYSTIFFPGATLIVTFSPSLEPSASTCPPVRPQSHVLAVWVVLHYLPSQNVRNPPQKLPWLQQSPHHVMTSLRGSVLWLMRTSLSPPLSRRPRIVRLFAGLKFTNPMTRSESDELI